MQRVILVTNLINASTTGTLTTPAIDCRSFSNLTLYSTGAGTVSGGVVVIEEAATADYSGTWSAIAGLTDPTAASGGKTIAVHLITGAYGFLRARLTTQISGGGSWSLDLVGN